MNKESSCTLREALAAAVVARMLAKAEEFNREVVALPVPPKPVILKADRLAWAHTALQEELDEFIGACNDDDVLEASDALIDLIYFALGRLTEMGVPAAAVFDEVQRANMDKQRGSLSKRPGSMGHDAVKPEGWEAPDHSWLVGFSLEDARKARMWDQLSPVIRKVAELRIRKGQDYNAGPQLTDYFPFGHLSYAQMIHIKNLRIQSLIAVEAQGKTPNFDGLTDSLEDLINYATFYAEAIASGSIKAEAGAQAREAA